jgi:hypothetical protein
VKGAEVMIDAGGKLAAERKKKEAKKKAKKKVAQKRKAKGRPRGV